MQENLEIERRFFIDEGDSKPWMSCESKSKIMQFYIDSLQINIKDGVLNYGPIGLVQIDEKSGLISTTKDWTARIRYSDSSTFLTMKGKRIQATAVELEWPIERDIAEEIFLMEDFPLVEKTRYNWRGSDGMLWEIDVFEGGLEGLVLAEVELPSENHPVEIPSWIGQEITGDGSWSNAALAYELKSQST
tara:strand:- start:1982 stop:2551 length:570 start_codon:yes stop_codon:yes gene_type:complete